MSKLANLKKYIDKNKSRAIKHMDKVFDISRFSDENIFYMLTFCILVPAGKATRCNDAVTGLKMLNYYNKGLSRKILSKLLTPLIRFPKQKMERLISLHNKKEDIIFLVRSYARKLSPIELRDALVKEVDGLGYKAASHFLRNLGVNELAIIDVHILKYSEYFFHSSISTIPSVKNKYELVESFFNKWAEKEFDLCPSQLDWLIWCMESGNDVEALDC